MKSTLFLQKNKNLNNAKRLREEAKQLREEATRLAEEKERLRPKDKYDLAVAIAVKKGLKAQAEDEKRIARKLRHQKEHKARKKEKRQSKSSVTNNPVCAIPLNKAVNDLKSAYSKKYPNSYSTQKMLIDGNIRSYKELCRKRVNSVSVRVLKKRIDKYYPMFTTIKMLYNSDMKAYEELNNY